MGLLQWWRKIKCERLGWHSAPTVLRFNPASLSGFDGPCPYCGRRVLMDSQGNWFDPRSLIKEDSNGDTGINPYYLPLEDDKELSRLRAENDALRAEHEAVGLFVSDDHRFDDFGFEDLENAHRAAAEVMKEGN